MKRIFAAAALFLGLLAQAEIPKAAGLSNDLPTAAAGIKYDIFLPSAYDKEATRVFPVLYLCHSASVDKDWTAWAEANNFILITFETQNGDFDPINKTQEAVFAETNSLRLHPCLRYTIGSSGGAMSGLAMANRHLDMFAGCIMNCHNGNSLVPEAKHLAMSFIYGSKDTIQDPERIKAAFAVVERKGNLCFIEEVEMGHTWAPFAIRTKHLERLHAIQRLKHPKLSADEKKAAFTELTEQFAAAQQGGEPAQILKAAESILDCDLPKGDKQAVQALQAWQQAKVNQLKELPPKELFIQLVDDGLLAERMKTAGGSAKASFSALQRANMQDKDLKEEYADWLKYAAVLKKIERAKNDPGKIAALKDDVQKFLAKAGPTYAADKAKAWLEAQKK